MTTQQIKISKQYDYAYDQVLLLGEMCLAFSILQAKRKWMEKELSEYNNLAGQYQAVQERFKKLHNGQSSS